MTSKLMKIYKEEEFSELRAELFMALLTSEHLSCCGKGGGGEGGNHGLGGVQIEGQGRGGLDDGDYYV